MTAERHPPSRFVVAPEDQGRRLDQVLAARISGLSRRRARVALDLGGVFVDGARTKVAGRIVRAGQVIVAHLGGALDRATKQAGAEARARDDAALPPFRIVHQDDDLVIVDKPSGLLTAPTPESDRGNLASALSRVLSRRVSVVHRLDMETSGLLVFALGDESNRVLAERFRTHDVERVYLAVLRGVVSGDAHTVDVPLAGRRAVTHIQVAERFDGATLVRCRLETGRTHQIRLHAHHLGHPVLGDAKHGVATAIDPPRMALHAMVLGFRHPHTGAALRFESGWPQELAGWLEGLRAGAPPHHGSRFDAHGSVLSGPAQSSLEPYQVTIDATGGISRDADVPVDPSVRTAPT
jgi:23S rRNA pseudouridine1911/1915/1917 synthase